MFPRLIFSSDDLIFGGGVFRPGAKFIKPKKIEVQQGNLSDLPNIPFHERIIEPVFLEMFRQKNDATVKLPPKIKLDLHADPRLPYQPRSKRSVGMYPELETYNKFLHIGQRKLLVSELQHLIAVLANKHEHAIVVYAGSAPTNKAWMEHLLFPNVKFLLVDPNMFNIYITTYRDSHYKYCSDPENGIIYYVNSITNYNAAYEVEEFGIKYFDGTKESVIADKYQKEAPHDDGMEAAADAYIKHFYESHHRIFICETFFTGGKAEFCRKLFDARANYAEYRDAKVIFWSDIRTNDGEAEDYPSDLDVLWNLAQMYNWCRVMQPDYAMLKFRCPFALDADNLNFIEHKDEFDLALQHGNNFQADIKKYGHFKYFKGDIYIQAWPSRASTETRLWIDGETIANNELVVYDHLAYEETLFYYNMIERTSMLHENNFMSSGVAFDNCGDCAIEATVWSAYKNKMDKTLNVEFWVSWTSELTARTLARAGHGRLVSKVGNLNKFYGGAYDLAIPDAELPFYIKLIDEKYRPLYEAADTPRRIHATRTVLAADSDPKLDINPATITESILDPQTLELRRDLEEARILHFSQRRAELGHLWHLAEKLEFNTDAALVIYVGSANRSGSTLNILHKAYPNVRFLLIDHIAHYISLGKAGDYHYFHYAYPDFHIAYLSLNNGNYSSHYSRAFKINDRYGVKYFDGQREILLDSKYKYLGAPRITEDSITEPLLDYIFTSKNRFFIMEQLFDENLADAMVKIIAAMKYYKEFEAAKTFLWVDALFGPASGQSIDKMTNYSNTLNFLSNIYIWSRIIKPHYASILFKPPRAVEHIDLNELPGASFNRSKKLGNDIVRVNNLDKKISFFKGELRMAPYTSIYNYYTTIWYERAAIEGNTLVQYDTRKYCDAMSYFNMIERFSMMHENPAADIKLGFDHCNDCSIEYRVWSTYLAKCSDDAGDIAAWIKKFNKLYGGFLLDNVHGYLFPDVTKINSAIYLEKLANDTIIPAYRRHMTAVGIFKLPKLLVDTDKTLDISKIPQSDYNDYVNKPTRKFFISGVNHLLNSADNRHYSEKFVVVYCGCVDDHAIHQIAKVYSNVKFILFSRELVNIFINGYDRPHWTNYNNWANNICYFSIAKNRDVAEDFVIRPVNYFDGREQVYLLDKNTEEYEPLDTICKIRGELLENYSEYIFKSNKRIFVCEEELTEESIIVLQKILYYKHQLQSISVNTSIFNNNITLWANYYPISIVKMFIKHLDPAFVRYIARSDAIDSNEFYESTFHYLPWSSREVPEIEIQVRFPRSSPMQRYDFELYFKAVFHYNMIDRVLAHVNPVKDKNIGYDCCGDCALEARIFEIVNKGYNSVVVTSGRAGIKNMLNLFTLCNNISMSFSEKSLKKSGHGLLYY